MSWAGPFSTNLWIVVRECHQIVGFMYSRPELTCRLSKCCTHAIMHSQRGLTFINSQGLVQSFVLDAHRIRCLQMLAPRQHALCHGISVCLGVHACARMYDFFRTPHGHLLADIIRITGFFIVTSCGHTYKPSCYVLWHTYIHTHTSWSARVRLCIVF